ncbi:hypothetical protein [Nannocystis pusilla]
MTTTTGLRRPIAMMTPSAAKVRLLLGMVPLALWPRRRSELNFA